jgi:hypothetical protein
MVVLASCCMGAAFSSALQCMVVFAASFTLDQHSHLGLLACLCWLQTALKQHSSVWQYLIVFAAGCSLKQHSHLVSSMRDYAGLTLH